MDNKKFASQVTLLILINLLVKLIWIFFIERKVQIIVGFEDFGLYYILFSFTLILGVINDPGLNNYLIQYISKNKTHTQHISELFYIKTTLAGFYVFVTIIIALLLGFNNYNLLALLIFYQILYSFLNYFRGFLKAHQLLKSEIFFSVLDKSLFIIAFLPILYFNNSFNWTVSFYIIAQIMALTLSLIVCVYYLHQKRIVVFTKEALIFNFSIVKKIAPFAIFAFLVLAYSKIDTVMLTKMLPNGNEQTGIYVAAYRFLDASTMLPILFATLLYPVLCNIINDQQKVHNLINNSISILIPITLIIAMASWFYKTQLMTFLYGQNSSDQLSLIFGILMFSLPLVVLYYVFSTFFTAGNHLKLLNVVSASGLVINIGLNFLLIPIYQALGAAISSLASFSLVGLAYSFFYYLKFKYAFPILIWSKILIFTTILVTLGYLITAMLQNWMLGFFVYLALSILLSGLLKLFDFKKIKNIVRIKS